MKAMYLAGGDSIPPSLSVLASHLSKAGHRVTYDANDPKGWDVTVRWGISFHGNQPAINAAVNKFDKLGAMFQFVKAKVSTPFPHTDFEDAIQEDKGSILLARKIKHTKGKDIIVCKTLPEIRKAASKRDFYVKWIPTQTEYRVWVFQKRILSVSEKIYKGEGEYTGYIRNRRFGFKFVKRDDLRKADYLSKLCINAVKALGMDFGAVDVLAGKDGEHYVLEVNSMPAIDSVKRSSGIRLAAAISKWAEGV